MTVFQYYGKSYDLQKRFVGYPDYEPLNGISVVDLVDTAKAVYGTNDTQCIRAGALLLNPYAVAHLVHWERVDKLPDMSGRLQKLLCDPGVGNFESYCRASRDIDGNGGIRARNIARQTPTYYSAYMTTQHWATLRHKAMQHFFGQCSGCGTQYNLEMHHLRYENLGNEQLWDVAIKCNECHWLLHENRCGVKLPPKCPEAVIQIFEAEGITNWRSQFE